MRERGTMRPAGWAMEILLSASEFMLHGGAFAWEGAQRLQKIKALAWMAEKALGAEKGHFNYLYEKFEKEGDICD